MFKIPLVFALAILFETVMAYRVRVMAQNRPKRLHLLPLVIVECSLWATVIRTLILDVTVIPWYAAGAVVGVMIASYIGVGGESKKKEQANE